MIRINNLDFSYKKSRPVFESVSLELATGIYGLLGENGTGKTTLLNLISGLRFPNNGTVEVCGFEPALRLPEMFNRFFFLPDEYLIPSESIYSFAKRHAGFYPNFNQEQLTSYLKEFKIDGTQKLSELSFGQKRKAMLAYIIALNTNYLLLDEPTNGLDISSKAAFKKILTQAATEDKCIVVSTHLAHDFENLLDGVIILEGKQILLSETVAEITDKLLFKLSDAKPQNALYVEQTLHGYASVLINDNKEESMMSIEMLYKAALNNVDLMRTIFKK